MEPNDRFARSRYIRASGTFESLPCIESAKRFTVVPCKKTKIIIRLEFRQFYPFANEHCVNKQAKIELVELVDVIKSRG